MNELATTDHAPSAGEAARTEHVQIMTDPTHAMHEAYKRGEDRVQAYIETLYRKAQSSGPAPPSQGVRTGHASLPDQPDGQRLEESPEERAARLELDSTLRASLGERYDSEMDAMRQGAQRLFSSPDHVKALDVLAPMISELGPQAEIAGIQFLAQLRRLTNK